VVKELRRGRNIAVHDRNYAVESDEVREYVKLAGRVRSALRLAGESKIAVWSPLVQESILVRITVVLAHSHRPMAEIPSVTRQAPRRIASP